MARKRLHGALRAAHQVGRPARCRLAGRYRHQLELFDLPVPAVRTDGDILRLQAVTGVPSLVSARTITRPDSLGRCAVCFGGSPSGFFA